MASDILVDTAVVRNDAAPGRYTARLTGAWSFVLPSGGVLMTAALRAIEAELADATMRPLSATALFCSPVPEGAISIQVDVLRRGSSAVQARAAVSPAGTGELGFEVSATFGRDRSGPDFVDVERPEAPLPESLPEHTDPGLVLGRAIPFWEQIDLRLAGPPLWWQPGWSPGAARVLRWMRYKKPPRRPDGTLDPLTIPPLADTMPPALVQRLGPGHRIYAPSLDLTVHFLEPIRTEWLLVRTHARHVRAGYASGENEIWSADGRLVAYATQMMFLRQVDR